MLNRIMKILFSDGRMPVNAKFKLNEKVFCSRTHEVTKSIVSPGVVLGFSHYEKSYWSFGFTNHSIWYKVRYKNGIIIRLPEERLENLSEFIKNTEAHLNRRDSLVGISPIHIEKELEAKQTLIDLVDISKDFIST